MNKEQQDIILDVYREHCLEQSKYLTHGGTIQEFINKCKTDTEFSEKWGLTIEERELSFEERYKIALPIWKEKYGLLANMMVPTNVDNTPYKIPTKLITITYNDKTIESYEQ
jgi:hypothetical protein